jgi:uncharacterized repeat protein (TIGR01451 family)
MGRVSFLIILILLAQIIVPQGAAANCPQPDIDVTPLSIDFGTVPVGTNSLPQTVTVANNGDADLIINWVDISGTDASEFFIASVNTTSEIIPPGGSASGTVCFAPTSIGDKTALLKIYSNDPCIRCVCIPLEGTGTETPPLEPDIFVSPTYINFNEVETGSSSSPETVIVTNEGSGNLTVSSVYLDSGTFFSIQSDNATGVIVPGGTAEITIIYSPDYVETDYDYLRIVSNDSDEGTVTVNLEGSGTETPPAQPDITVSPTDIDFGMVYVGSPSSPRTVTVTNDGTANLTVGSITINHSLFVITSDNISGQELIPGTSAKLSLIFTPDIMGAQSANLTIPSNDPDENPFYVTLSGLGIKPIISLAPSVVGFGSIPVGSSSSPQTVTVTNTGNAPLVIGTFHTAGTDYDQFTISSDNASGKTLAAGENATLQVTFNPLSAGGKIAGLEVSSNDPDKPTTSITLTGTGLVPNISVSPSTLNLGLVPVGSSSAPGVITVTNIGEALLNVGTVQIAGGDSGYFSIESDNVSDKSLAIGASANISVRFNPTVAGVKGAQVVIPSNDPDTPAYATIYGEGIEPDIDVNPTEIDFGSFEVNHTSPARVVTITNSGTDNLTIENITIIGMNPGDFNIISDNASGETLIPDASANVSVQFHPTTTGDKEAKLRIPSNDPDEDPVDVDLYGTGMPEPVADIEVTPEFITFSPPVYLGEISGPEAVMIKNVGTANLTIGTISTGGTNPGDFIISSDNASGKTLPPGTATTVQVIFKPTAAGSRTGKLQIPSNDPDEIQVDVTLTGTGAGIPKMQVRPTFINFGAIQVGTSSPARTITVTNTGTGDLPIDNVELWDYPTPHFKIISNNASGKTLAPGESANISVKFSPTTTGDKDAYLIIESYAPPYYPYRYVGLYGTATEAPQPYLHISPTWVDFGTVPEGTSSTPRVITITNIGGADLHVYTLILEGPDTTHFSIIEDHASNQWIAPGASVNFSVQFSPTTTGPKWTYIWVDSNDYYSYPFVDFIGNADPSLKPDISVEPDSIDFGDIPVGSASPAETVTISNDGNKDLVIGTITVIGGDAGQFTILSDNASTETLAPGVSANVSVRFNPTNPGLKSAGLRILSGDPDENPVYVNLTGTGIGPDIDVTPASINFSYLLVGDTSSPETVTITNSGTANLTIGTVDITGADASQFVIASDNVSGEKLPPGASANVSVTFKPTLAGAYSANLTIPSDDPDENPVYVPLSGTGTETPPEPDISVVPRSINFGLVEKGYPSSSENVTVSNNGTAILTIGNLTIDDNQFYITSGNITDQKLSVGASANITLVFKPNATGGQSANLTIPSDAPNQGTVTVTLSGTGTEPPTSKADLEISKTGSPDPIALSDNLTYTLTVKNNGPGNATGVSVTDNLSQYLVFVSANNTAGTADVSFNATDGTVNWNIGNLANGENATLEIVTTLDPLVASYEAILSIFGFAGFWHWSYMSEQITNTASVAGEQADPDMNNNTASVDTGVQKTNLVISKTDKEDPVAFGDNITWYLTVTNAGPITATDVVALDLYFPVFINIEETVPEVGSVSQTPPQWLDDAMQEAGANSTSILPGFSVLYWDIGDLASGASANLTIIASTSATVLLSENSTITITPSMVGYVSALADSSEQIEFPYPNYAFVFNTMVDSDISNNFAEETTSLWWNLPETDLEITKTDSPDPVAPDGDITYTINIKNNGPEDAPHVYVIDSWDENALIYQSATASQGTANQTTLQWLIDFTNELGSPINAGDNYLWWNAGPLAVGESANLTMVASVNATMAVQLGNISNTGLVFGDVWDIDASNNTATENTTIGIADLAISKTASPQPVAYGDNITYKLTVTNNGPTDASGVNVTDELPDSVIYQSANASAGTAEHVSGNVTWAIGDLAYGESANLTIVVKAPSPSEPVIIINTATVTGIFPDPDTENNSASANTTVVPPESADLAITKTASPEPVATSANITYKITVRNNGPANASNVSVTDELPESVGVLSDNATTGTISYAANDATWTIGDLAYGESANLTIIVRAPDYTANITNTATVGGDYYEVIPENNTASANTTVVPPGSADLEISKADSPDPVNTRGDLTYTITVKNNGPASATGINVIDALPESIFYKSATPTAGEANYASGNVTWNIESLEYGASANLTILVSAPLEPGIINNTASVSSDNDPIPANNTASENTTVKYVVTVADLSITKSDNPDPVANGGDLTYTITVTNDGPGNATGVRVTDALPTGEIFRSATPSTGQVSYDSGIVTWDIESLEYNASAILYVLVTAPIESGAIINRASVRGDQADPAQFNNTAVIFTIVMPTINLPDITVTPKTVDFSSVRSGTSSAPRTVTVTNNGTAGLFISAITINNSRFVITSSDITGEILTPGTSAEIDLIFRPTSSGGQSATMSITSNDPDEHTVNVLLSGTGTTSPGPGPGPNPPETSSTETTPNYFTVDFLGKITQELATSDGRPIKSMSAPSPDGIHLLEIEANTGASDNAGITVTLLEIREAEVPELPENTKLIGKAYEFKPSGTVFDRPVRLTLGYNVNELPDRVTSVGAAYFTTEDGWTYLDTETTSVAELGKLTAPVNHFTVFAVLATVGAEPPPPEPTSTTTPEPEPEPEPEPGPSEALFQVRNLSITPIVTRFFENFAYIVRTGEEALITVEVTNNGGQTGSYAAILIINGVERERTEVTLEPGKTRKVSFTTTDNEPGTYNVVIGDVTGDFLSRLWINWWLIGGSAGFFIIIIWAVWYYIKKKRQAQI